MVNDQSCEVDLAPSARSHAKLALATFSHYSPLCPHVFYDVILGTANGFSHSWGNRGAVTRHTRSQRERQSETVDGSQTSTHDFPPPIITLLISLQVDQSAHDKGLKRKRQHSHLLLISPVQRHCNGNAKQPPDRAGS